MEYQAPLSTKILKEYTGFLQSINKVPSKLRIQKMIEGTGGMVSVIDLIAYQIGWGKLFIYWYESGIADINPIMPGEGFSKWDYNALARHFYSKYHFDGAQKQMEEFESVVSTILNIVETEFKAGNLERLGVWEWCTLASGKQWPLSKWITVNTAAPYKRANQGIKKLLVLK
jgi:hypothetical protein